LHEDWGPEEVLQFALAWNRLNKPPLPEKEVKTTVQSIHKTRQNGVKGSVSQFGSPIVGGKTAKLEVTTLADIYKAPDPSWLVEKLLLDGSVTLLSAYAKDGKTFLTQEIARCVATGEPLFGFLETNQGSVLFVDSENNWSLLKDRYEKLGVSDSLPINYLSFQSVRLDTASGIEALKGKVEELQPRLVIFDTLTRFHKKKENEAGEMSNVMEALRGLAKPGRTVLPLHHNRKGTDGRPEESPRGSGDILASVDNLIILKKDKDCFVLAFQTGRTEGLGRPIRYKIESAESGSICFSYQGNVLSKEEELVQNVVKALKDNELGVEDIRMELSKAELAVGEKKLRETLNRHENREFLVRITGHNKALYKVNPDWQFGGGI
jgi:RecA-family ATPase